MKTIKEELDTDVKAEKLLGVVDFVGYFRDSLSKSLSFTAFLAPLPFG